MKTDRVVYDVAIVGGGPAGSTTATLLKKYAPNLNVVLLEREMFPRNHIGESLLPPISPILQEMGCWDKVEAANFPIKIGATYRWGRKPELWNFEFFPAERFVNEPRPARFEGQRLWTAFQVDRSVYDTILLEHCAELGCEVRQGAKVVQVDCNGSEVEALQLADGTSVKAKYYVDASGNSGILRRAMNVSCHFPSTLRNIAIYDYWQNATWAYSVGNGGTRILVLSLGYGWLWFIPIGTTRTSLGLVVPAKYYGECGLRPEELYLRAISEEPIVESLIKGAVREQDLQTTRDWSFIAAEQSGENWFLVGEAGGFADPILSAGVTMAHQSAQQLAYTILEIERAEIDPSWLRAEFGRRQKQRINTHIRFGDYWYTANEQLTELKEFTAELAEDVGLHLDPESAWDWIARGGFIDDDMVFGSGGFRLSQIRASSEFLMEVSSVSLLEQYNILELDLHGATVTENAVYLNGRVERGKCYARGDRLLPVQGQIRLVVEILQKESRLPNIMSTIQAIVDRYPKAPVLTGILRMVPDILDAMIRDGWIRCSYDPSLPTLPPQSPSEGGFQRNKGLSH